MILNLQISKKKSIPTFFVQGLFFFLSTFGCFTAAWSQTIGDYRSKASGNWSDFTTWEIYDGAVWQNAVAGQVPSGTNEADASNVYLEAGYTITLISDAACKDIHLNTTADVIRINTQNNVLNVWGKMRFYEGVAPGAGTPSIVTSSGVLGWMTTGASGYIRFRGTVDRIIMVQGEVNANNTNSGWNFDFAFDNGIVGQLNERIRTGNTIITSGELFMNNASAQLRVGTNGAGDVTPNGSAVIKSGAILRGGEGIFKNTTTAAQSIILEDGATLILARSGYILAAVNLTLSGTVVIQAGGITFPTAASRADASVVNLFNHLTLEGTGSKMLQNNVTVSGTMKLGGTTSLNLNTFILDYGANGELEYNGTAAQNTSSSEFPVTGGPNQLTINNINGVTLHANRLLDGELTLASGLFLLGNNHLTLGASSPAIAGTLSVDNMIVTSGTGELRKVFNAPGYFFYPIGETTGTTEYTYGRIDVNSSDALDATTYVGMRVIDNVHPAAVAAAENISRYWSVSSNMTTINYDATLQYLPVDINGTEANINAYNYVDESPLAMGAPIIRLNASFDRIEVPGLSAGGYITGANFCMLSDNIIDYTGATSFCEASTLSESFTGSEATVTSTSPTYQWQQKINTGTWGDIASASAKDYMETTSLTPNTYYYRRALSDPAYCLITDIDYSNEISLNVYPGITGNEIGEDQILADGATPDPFTQVATLAGGTGTYTYQWQNSATMGGPYSDIPLENDATYTAPAGSTSMFFVLKVESDVCSVVSNEVSISIITSTVSTDQLNGIKLYPNPLSEQLVIDLDLAVHDEVEISIINSTGNIVHKQHADPNSTFSIDMSTQLQGIYFAHVVIDGEKSVVYKIVKQ